MSIIGARTFSQSAQRARRAGKIETQIISALRLADKPFVAFDQVWTDFDWPKAVLASQSIAGIVSFDRGWSLYWRADHQPAVVCWTWDQDNCTRHPSISTARGN